MALKMNDLISLKSHHGKYLVAEADGRLNANRDRIGSWEKFTILDPNNTASTREAKYGDTISLRSYHGKYVVAEVDGKAKADRTAIGPWEKWTILDPNNSGSRAVIPDNGRMALQSVHGKYLVAEADHTVNANRTAIGPWETWALIKGAVGEEKIDAAEVVSHDLPSSMIAGATYNASVTMRNTGTSIWTRAAGYKLGAVNDNDPLRQDNRVWLPEEISVPPNSTYTFRFALQAPNTPGSYLTDWQMVHEGARWFGGIAQQIVSITRSDNKTDAAVILSSTLPSVMIAGTTLEVSVTVQNTGATTWTRAAEYKLGAVNDNDPFRQDTRVWLPEGVSIPPNSIYTFNFTLQAPITPDSYVTDWQMVHEGVRWFGNAVRKTVSVIEAKRVEYVNPNYRGFEYELARRWAPIHYHDIDPSGYRADYICKVNFDGDWKTIGNWDNMNRFPLISAVYFSVEESVTHWFIVYMFYHPRDWSDIPVGDEHENDAEGFLAIVQKPVGIEKEAFPFGFLTGMITIAHWWFYSYSNVLRSGRADNVDGKIYFARLFDGIERPTSFQEANGHGCKAWDARRNFPGNDGIRFYPWHWAAEPGKPFYGKIGEIDAPYVLVDIFEPGGLWARRCTPVNEPFAPSGSFAGRKKGTDKAGPPWKWDSKSDGSRLQEGLMAYDPARLTDQYFSGHTRFSREYVNKRYFRFGCSQPPAAKGTKNLSSMLKSADPGKRNFAAAQLVAQNDTTAIDYLLEACLEENFSREAFAVLSTQAGRDENFRITLSKKVAGILNAPKASRKTAGGKRAFRALLEPAKLEPLVRLAGELRAPNLAAFLVEVYRDQKDNLLSGMAVDALAKLPRPKGAATQRIVKRGLNSSDAKMKAASTRLYGHWYAQEEIDPLEKLAFDDHPNVRQAAVEALEGLKSSDSKKILKQVLSDPQWEVKVAATKILMRNLGKDSLDIVKSKLKPEFEYAARFLETQKPDLTEDFSDSPQTMEAYGRLGLITEIAEGLKQVHC